MRSAIRPKGTEKVATGSMYAVTSHPIVAAPTPNSLLILGIARLVAEPTKVVVNEVSTATRTTAR